MDMPGNPFGSIRTGDARLQNQNKHAAETAIQELHDEYTVEPGSNRHVKLGQTSHQFFRFRATATGNSILRFAYRRPFNDDAAVPADSVIVQVRATGAGDGDTGGPGSEGEGRVPQEV